VSLSLLLSPCPGEPERFTDPPLSLYLTSVTFIVIVADEYLTHKPRFCLHDLIAITEQQLCIHTAHLVLMTHVLMNMSHPHAFGKLT
jgi:hypothetical protein